MKRITFELSKPYLLVVGISAAVTTALVLTMIVLDNPPIWFAEPGKSVDLNKAFGLGLQIVSILIFAVLSAMAARRFRRRAWVITSALSLPVLAVHHLNSVQWITVLRPAITLEQMLLWFPIYFSMLSVAIYSINLESESGRSAK